MEKSIAQLVKEIEKKFQRSRHVFEPFIEYIRFPHYKNFENDAKITFDFPFTVFIGKNGSGKSSALHALYGVPRGNSTGNFWFSTKVDPIEDSTDAPHCHIHAYRIDGKIEERLKTRITRKYKLDNYVNEETKDCRKPRVTRKINPDYWEPSRPLQNYNMDMSQRRNPIEKKMIYLDFRSELSAFDKFFYFGNFIRRKTIRSRQDVIRKGAKQVRRALDVKESMKVGQHGKRRCKKAIVLSKNEMRHIVDILNKPYTECMRVEHNFFDGRQELSATAYFKTDSLNYSEAFAGRGEFAIVQIVHEIENAEDNTLVLLDEPEVSLHPGAQQKLKKYLLQKILEKNLQVIISTHSEHFIEELPDKAIKLFVETPNSQVHVYNECHPLIAFDDIGIPLNESEKAIIEVEDKNSKIIIENILKLLGREYEEMFRVVYYPGGAPEIFKSAVGYAQRNECNKFIILDGDQRRSKVEEDGKQCEIKIPETEELPQGIGKLEEIIKRITEIGDSKLPFRFDGGDGDKESQKRQEYTKYLEYLRSHCGYLPCTIPEEIIWDEKTVNDLGGNTETIQGEDCKEKIRQVTLQHIGDDKSSSCEAMVQILVKKFIERNSQTETENYIAIKDTINRFKKIFEEHNR